MAAFRGSAILLEAIYADSVASTGLLTVMPPSLAGRARTFLSSALLRDIKDWVNQFVHAQQ